MPAPQLRPVVTKRRGAATALANYASTGEILKTRSPGGINNSSYLNESLNAGYQSKIGGGMSRNPAGRVGAYTQMKSHEKSGHPHWTSQTRTLSTKAGSVSRVASVLPQIAQNSHSRQQILQQARAGNTQSALSLHRDMLGEQPTTTQDSEYPYATLAAKRKLLRLQHMMNVSQDTVKKEKSVLEINPLEGKIQPQWKLNGKVPINQKSYASLDKYKDKFL